jgi:hypothetical protein
MFFTEFRIIFYMKLYVLQSIICTGPTGIPLLLYLCVRYIRTQRITNMLWRPIYIIILYVIVLWRKFNYVKISQSEANKIRESLG